MSGKLPVTIAAVCLSWACAHTPGPNDPIPIERVDVAPVLLGCPGEGAAAGPNKKWAFAIFTVTAEGTVVDARPGALPPTAPPRSRTTRTSTPGPWPWRRPASSGRGRSTACPWP